MPTKKQIADTFRERLADVAERDDLHTVDGVLAVLGGAHDELGDFRYGHRHIMLDADAEVFLRIR